jgi:hypothetical protein
MTETMEAILVNPEMRSVEAIQEHLENAQVLGVAWFD